MSEGPESARTKGSQEGTAGLASERPTAPLDSGPYKLCEWAISYDVSRLTSAKSFDVLRASTSVLDVAIKLAGGSGGVVLHQEPSENGDPSASPRAGLVARIAKNLDAEAVLSDPRTVELLRDCMREGRALPREGSALEISLGECTLLALPLRVRLRSPRPIDSGVSPRERRKFPQTVLVKPVGAILLARENGAPPLRQDQLHALESFSLQAAELIVHARLFQQATRDELTDFFQRRELEQLLQVELTLAEHAGVPLALLMVAIDSLGLVLERAGRASSEKLIERVARLLRAQVRDEDACVRYGAGEFAVLLPSTDEAGATFTGEKIRKAVSEYEGFGKGQDLTVSIGAAVFPHHGAQREELLKRADQTLFMATSEGGDRVLVWHKGISRYALRSDKLIGIITGNHAKDYRNVTMLLDTVVVVNSLLERKQMLGTLLDMMIQLAASERGVLFLEKNGVLHAEVSQDQKRNPVEPRDVCDELVARVQRDSIPLRIEADGQDEEHESLADALRRRGLERAICVPLSVKGRDVGCMYFDVRKGQKGLGTFEESDLIFFQALAREIGSALEHARLYEENEKKKQEVEKLNAQLSKKLEAQAEELEELEIELEELKLKYNYDKIVGKSQALQKVFRLLDRVTDSDVSVLIQGETGTGKELVAKALHLNGPRKHKPFVSVNCSAIAESLMESELFGHVKGAFTGADQDKKGLFEQADGGTIFLDEVQDMSRGLQRELLRVIQEQEIRRVGGKDVLKINVRVISATNRDLRDLVKKGEFREDLYYRLNVVFIELPPLRDRKEDIPPMLLRLIEEHKQQEGRELKLEKAAMRAILRHDWPGNVRELQNWFEKTCLMLEGDTIREADVVLDGEGRGSAAGGVSGLFDSDYKNAKEAFLREYLRAVLARNQGNVTRAAGEAGIVRSSFHKMMRKHGLRARDFGGR
ncbi:sigma 54-interacting transcriptional regulator [bacterium]|nr:sigma 54-interacting transcriptional regulator [bacterium]